MKFQFLTVTATTIAMSTSVDAQAATCPLNCDHNSQCLQGSADWGDQPTDYFGNPFTFHKDTTREGWYCDCPEDFTGLRCAREVTKCDDAGHYCYHGGECIDFNGKVGEQLLFCDCTNAEHAGKPYVGKFCEIEADLCVDDGSSDVFCTSGGSCVEGFENKVHPCDCPTGKRGPHCEFDTGHVPTCTLQCENDGECTLGLKSYEQAGYSEFWALHDGNFQYCSCPDGFYGPTCAIEGQECGDKHCFNGAACLETLDASGQTTYGCDCRAAHTDEDSFGGQYCQEKSTSFCNKDANANGHLFCVNGGSCKEDDHEGCDCPTGFHGPICEFTDAMEAPACNLQCQNGGKCRKGKKDNQLIEQFGENLQAFANKTHLGLWEHCVCPDGYFGIQCEHQLEICPGGDHVCLHGSKCVPTDETGSNKSHKCDCDHGFNGNDKYAGKFCQYTSTDICTKNGRPGSGKANFAFCVNNGKCKSKVDGNQPHPGCTCDAGYTGEHCEFLEQDSELAQGGSSSSTNPATNSGAGQDPKFDPNEGLVVGLAVAMFALVAIVGAALIRNFTSGKESDTGDDKLASPKAAAPIPEPEAMQATSEPSGPTPFEAEETITEPKPSKDADLKTVEII